MNRTAQTCVTALMAVACAQAHYAPSNTGPAVVMEHHIAEGHNPDAVLASPSVADAGAPSSSSTAADAGAPSSSSTASPPPPEPTEPEPLRLADQWRYELAYEQGRVTVVRVTSERFRRPVVTARNLGRYAIELWIGRELIDRVRFDFPLVGGEKQNKLPTEPAPPPSFAAGVRVRIKILVPASPRARRAVLIDREAHTTTELPWPPDHPLPPPDASSPRAGSVP